MTSSAEAGSREVAMPAVRGLYEGFEGYVTATADSYHRVLREGMVAPDANVLLTCTVTPLMPEMTFWPSLSGLVIGYGFRIKSGTQRPAQDAGQ